MYLAELTCTAALLLVAIVGTGCLGDGFAIRNALLVKFNGNLIQVFQTPFKRTEVELSLTVHEDLAQFLALLYFPRGVFLTHAVQCRHHLFGVGLVHRLNGAGIFGVGVFDKVEAVLAGRKAEQRGH